MTVAVATDRRALQRTYGLLAGWIKGDKRMMNINRNVIAALVLVILAAGVSGCKKEGPMERSGREIDKAVEKTGQQIDKTVEKSGEKMKETGDKIKDSVK
jgi:hypothetical protein